MIDKKTHWENVFATKQETEVSWYQQKPTTSLQFFTENNIAKNAKIIDIGGGDSYLIDNLIALGYTNLYLLDISENALAKTKLRLGENQKYVTFIATDILEFSTQTTFDVWHDRASFHFLTSENEITTYKEKVTNFVSENGFLFIGSFSENGPLKCSGLEITQYNEKKLETIFTSFFLKINCFTENHETPFKTIQNFIFCSFKKRT